MAAFTRPVTIVRRTKGAPDAFGNDTWTTVGAVVQAVVAPVSGSEQVQGRDTLTEQTTVYLAAGTDISHLDAVVIGGQSWEVDGAPVVYEHALTGWRPGIEVRLRRVTG